MRQSAPASVRAPGAMHDGSSRQGFGCWLPCAGRFGSAGPTRRPRASGAGAPHARSWGVRVSPTSRSATFTARPSPSWARPERSGGPAGLLERARVARSDFTTCSSPISPQRRRQPLRARGRERRPRERRSGGQGSGAAAGSAANEARFAARSGQRVPEAERSSTRPQGRDRRKAVHGAHHSGCVSTRHWASARMRARSCTLTGPRWSSERWMT